jgi:predicted lipoprotein with Yx(FWY)xxD motif
MRVRQELWSKQMFKYVLGAAILFATASTVYAAEPGKTMDTSAGKVYVDERGMTLYTFDKDKANESACYDECAVKWPPYLADANAKSEGEWTLVERKDGSKMWAYENQPLYTYIEDKNPGDVTGDGVGGVWHIAKPD